MMIDAKDYKYLSRDDVNYNIVFAVVVKQPHWIGQAEYICHRLPVGAITWFSESYVLTDDKGNQYLPEEISVCPEANRYGMNFEPSCFELLPTFIQKVRRK